MKKMNAKRTLVSFLTIATLLFLVATVSAVEFTPLEADGNAIVADDSAIIEIDGMTVLDDEISVIAGEIISVKVYFTAADLDEDVDELGSASDVKIKAELGDVDVKTSSFDVEGGKRYIKTFTIRVPNELEDEISDDMTLNLKIWNSDFKSESEDIILRVQRPSHDIAIKSIIVSNSVEAGQVLPVDVVLENTGYNDLEDIYVTARIPELGVERTSYFGDLVAIEDRHDEKTVSGRIYLEVPYNVASGIYTLEVEVANEDFSNTVEEQVAVKDGFPEIAVKSGDNLLLLNPTNHLKVYKVVYPSTELTVVVQAGSSKLIPIEVSEGEYDFDVFVFSGNELVGTINFSGTSEEELATSPVLVLTVVLAIIFLVLLIVMIVLITKKPEKAEEFGESYY